MHCLLLYVGARAFYSQMGVEGFSWGLIWGFMWAPPFPFQFAMISMILQLYIFFVGSWLVRRFPAKIRAVFPHAAGLNPGALLKNAYMLGGVLLGAGLSEGFTAVFGHVQKTHSLTLIQNQFETAETLLREGKISSEQFTEISKSTTENATQLAISQTNPSVADAVLTPSKVLHSLISESVKRETP